MQSLRVLRIVSLAAGILSLITMVHGAAAKTDEKPQPESSSDGSSSQPDIQPDVMIEKVLYIDIVDLILENVPTGVHNRYYSFELQYEDLNGDWHTYRNEPVLWNAIVETKDWSRDVGLSPSSNLTLAIPIKDKKAIKLVVKSKTDGIDVEGYKVFAEPDWGDSDGHIQLEPGTTNYKMKVSWRRQLNPRLVPDPGVSAVVFDLTSAPVWKSAAGSAKLVAQGQYRLKKDDTWRDYKGQKASFDARWGPGDDVNGIINPTPTLKLHVTVDGEDVVAISVDIRDFGSSTSRGRAIVYRDDGWVVGSKLIHLRPTLGQTGVSTIAYEISTQ